MGVRTGAGPIINEEGGGSSQHRVTLTRLTQTQSLENNAHNSNTTQSINHAALI